MLSEKQLLANQRNALKSTGPRTEAGKARSRLNATRHGLAGAGVALPEEDQEKYTERLEEWTADLGPRDHVEAYLVQSAALASVRLDRCMNAEFAHSRAKRDETIQSWEQAQEQRLQSLIAGISSHALEVVPQLLQFSTGCEWLMFQWELVRDGLVALGHLDENNRTGAESLRLLGDPNEIAALNDLARGGGEPAQPAREALADMIEAELDHLEALRDALWKKQEAPLVKQVLEEEAFDASPRAVLMRRYETACRNDLHRALRDLARIRKDNILKPQEPAPVEAPSPAPEPALRNEAICDVREAAPVASAPISTPPTIPLGRAVRRKEARRRQQRERKAVALACAT